MYLILGVFVPLYSLCLSYFFFHLWLDIFAPISGHAESCKFILHVLSLLFFMEWGRNYIYFKRNIFFLPQKNWSMEEDIFLNKSICSCGSVPVRFLPNHLVLAALPVLSVAKRSSTFSTFRLTLNFPSKYFLPYTKCLYVL